MSSIFVAGRSGQLAQSLINVATARGLELIALGRNQLNLECDGAVERTVNAIRPAAIINAAAYTAVDAAETDPTSAFLINRDGAERLAIAARNLDIPFIHISTDYVFDGEKSFPYTEEDIPNPRNVYGRSKLEGEVAVTAAYPRAIILRTSWVYSAFGQNFLRTMLRLSEQVQEVSVVGDQIGAPTAAHDLASAIIDLLSTDRITSSSTGGTYHLTARGSTSWFGFASLIFDVCRSQHRNTPRLIPIDTANYHRPAARPANSRLDCAKAEADLGLRLPSWDASVRSCVIHVLNGPN